MHCGPCFLFQFWITRQVNDQWGKHMVSGDNRQIVGFPRGNVYRRLSFDESSLLLRMVVHYTSNVYMSTPYMSHIYHPHDSPRGNNPFATSRVENGAEADPKIGGYNGGIWESSPSPRSQRATQNGTAPWRGFFHRLKKWLFKGHFLGCR